jgi:hypothetical protein
VCEVSENEDKEGFSEMRHLGVEEGREQPWQYLKKDSKN